MQISNRVKRIYDLLTENQLPFNNLKGINQDMKNYLDNKACVYYQECSDMVINIDNKINKIFLADCDNITLTLGGLIAGIELNRCSNITIKSLKKESLNCILIEKSNNINITFSRKHAKKTICEFVQSQSINIADFNNKPILL